MSWNALLRGAFRAACELRGEDNFIATLTKHYGEVFPNYPSAAGLLFSFEDTICTSLVAFEARILAPWRNGLR